MTDKFPFAFDVNAMTEAFKVPGFDFGAVQAAHEKNVAALVEANKTAMAGYKDIYTKQVALFQASLADMKDQMAELQGQPLTADTATKNIETAKTAFEKAVADVTELTEMAQSAGTDALEILKARTEEVLAEIQGATKTLAA